MLDSWQTNGIPHFIVAVERIAFGNKKLVGSYDHLELTERRLRDPRGSLTIYLEGRALVQNRFEAHVLRCLYTRHRLDEVPHVDTLHVHVELDDQAGHLAQGIGRTVTHRERKVADLPVAVPESLIHCFGEAVGGLKPFGIDKDRRLAPVPAGIPARSVSIRPFSELVT